MDENPEYMNEFSIPNPREELVLDSEITGWQPFSISSKFQMQKQCPNLLLTQRSPRKSYDKNGSVDFLDRVQRKLSPSSDYRKSGLQETIVNTDFLSAIPYARQSKTVKRKLNCEDNRATKTSDTAQKPKTYFPFEFVGRATRESVSQENLNKESERFHDPAMASEHALRKLDVNGSIFQTAFSTQNEPPLPPRKRGKKYSSTTKTNSVVALEQHFEQIRRKHAEFNWDVPDSQNAMTNERVSSTEVDIQRVPTTPFIEQCTSPSLYSTNEIPFPTTMSWMPAPRLVKQNFEQRNQRFPMDVYNNSELWSTSAAPTEDDQENSSGTANIDHLYPY